MYLKAQAYSASIQEPSWGIFPAKSEHDVSDFSSACSSYSWQTTRVWTGNRAAAKHTMPGRRDRSHPETPLVLFQVRALHSWVLRCSSPPGPLLTAIINNHNVLCILAVLQKNIKVLKQANKYEAVISHLKHYSLSGLLRQLISPRGKGNKQELLQPAKQIPPAKLSIQKPLRCGNASEMNCPTGGGG